MAITLVGSNTSTGSGTHSVTPPTGSAAGDILLVSFAARWSTLSATKPAAVDLIKSAQGADQGGTCSILLYGKILTLSDLSTPLVFSGVSSSSSCIRSTYRSARGITVDAIGEFIRGTTSGNLLVPGVTATASGRTLVFSANDANSFAALPSSSAVPGWTDDARLLGVSGTAAGQARFGKDNPAGAIPTLTYDVNDSGVDKLAFMIHLAEGPEQYAGLFFGSNC